jgi:hypothetical protein
MKNIEPGVQSTVLREMFVHPVVDRILMNQLDVTENSIAAYCQIYHLVKECGTAVHRNLPQLLKVYNMVTHRSHSLHACDIVESRKALHLVGE